jgi:hypothetical protein
MRDPLFVQELAHLSDVLVQVLDHCVVALATKDECALLNSSASVPSAGDIAHSIPGVPQIAGHWYAVLNIPGGYPYTPCAADRGGTGTSMTGNDISTWIAELSIWPLVVMLLPYFFVFRKYGIEVQTKRLASLYHATAVFLLTTAGGAIATLELTDAYLVGAVALISLAAYLLRGRFFPYRLNCPGCGRRYNLLSSDFRTVYVMDDNLCDSCRAEAASDESPE